MTDLHPEALDRLLHDTEVERLETRLVQLAREATGAANGGLFVWNDEREALTITSHVVEGLVVRLPNVTVRPRHDGRPNGIALWVWEQNQPYLCEDTAEDPHYARYFVDVGSIAAAPIPYQKRALGVLTVSAGEAGALGPEQLERLVQVAQVAAKHLRRAQLFYASKAGARQPFLIKGISDEWLEVERRIEHAAPTDAAILIHGESGTGKELVANAVHFNSQRRVEPLVSVNCAAIPDSMLESILFGHVKGAFTGATFNKVGEFEKADGGTLFLDEVGELPLALQAKVLRAVEQGEVQPLGSNAAPKQVDVRLICATNRDLAAMVKRGEFRDDLYFRLSVVTMSLPPLRSYKATLPTLAHVFMQQMAHHHDKHVARIAPGAMDVLRRYEFPGNVRELKNLIEHAVIMAQGEEIEVADLPSTVGGSSGAPPARIPQGSVESRLPLKAMREKWLAPLERRYLEETLAECDGNVREAARRAGINTVTYYRLMKKRGLELRREVRAVDPG